MLVFIVNELRIKHPLITLNIFRRRNVTGATLLSLLMSASLFGMFFYLSIYLQQILRYSPTKTGLADVPFTIVMIIIAAILSPRIAKINPKPILVVGPLIVGGGLLLLSRLPLHASYVTAILPGVVLMAGGMALFFVTNTVVATTGSAHEEAGLISGLINIGQQIGGAVGLAVLSVVSTAATKHDLATAHGNPSAVPAALVYGFQRGYIVAVLFAVISSLVALTILKGRKPTAEEAASELEEDAESLAAIPGI